MLPEISIIIPFYNAEAYVEECIQNVLRQSFSNWELILINDGSKDLSGKIADDFSKNDSRIKILHKENEGVSIARNTGLQKAISKYCCFLDVDDAIGINYLQDLINDMSDSNADLVIQSIKRTKQGNVIDVIRSFDGIFSVDDSQIIFENVNIVQYGYCFSALFKTEIIKNNQISFPVKIDKCEDLLFFLKYITKTKTIKSSTQSNYFYKIDANNSSLSKKKQSFFTVINLFHNLYNILSIDFKIKDPREFPNLAKALYFNFHKGLDSVMNSDNSFIEKYRCLNQISGDEYKFFITDQSPTFKARVLENLLKKKLLFIYLLTVNIKE